MIHSLTISFIPIPTAPLLQIQKAISESYAEYMAGRAYVYNVARHLDLSVRATYLLFLTKGL
jgi:hypothetical protein